MFRETDHGHAAPKSLFFQISLNLTETTRLTRYHDCMSSLPCHDKSVRKHDLLASARFVLTSDPYGTSVQHSNQLFNLSIARKRKHRLFESAYPSLAL